MIATQKASIVQGKAEREARALRMSRIAEAILLLSMKTEPTPPPSNPACNPTCCVDLQNFRTSDGPIYIGPFHSIEPFLNWIKAAEIFFMANGVFHDTDRISIVGGLICKTNTLAFYTSKTDTFCIDRRRCCVILYRTVKSSLNIRVA
jgi:hypothetical protein